MEVTGVINPAVNNVGTAIVPIQGNVARPTSNEERPLAVFRVAYDFIGAGKNIYAWGPRVGGRLPLATMLEGQAKIHGYTVMRINPGIAREACSRKRGADQLREKIISAQLVIVENCDSELISGDDFLRVLFILSWRQDKSTAILSDIPFPVMQNTLAEHYCHWGFNSIAQLYSFYQNSYEIILTGSF
ncbi:MAG: hypothetical protein HQM09_23175 [Candidatus Riflebacteria bacterium]|nr:hypothetical protein [Candidatus Riflebacteria bacterium]